MTDKKIEEILEKHSVETIKLVGVNDPSTMYVGEESTGILEELTNLLNTEVQKVREEAVRGFVTDFIETGMYEGVNSIEDIMKIWRKENV